MEFIPVQSFNNYVEAHIAMGSLQQQDINCWLKDEYTVTIDPLLTNAIGGIKLMVAKVQVPRAMELLQQVKGGKLPQYACPHCGSRDIHSMDVPQKKITLFTALISRLLGNDDAAASKQVWHCANCGKDCEEPRAINTERMEGAK
jgi:DNA-directed RNA polymerase subunit RPC12/RpoP